MKKADSEEPTFHSIINYANNEYTTKDYTELGQTYQLVLPLSLEGFILGEPTRIITKVFPDMVGNTMIEIF